MILISDKPWRLIIDSDLLWFREPVEITNGIDNNYSLMMQGQVDKQMNYVYFKNNARLDQDLANYNSGIVLYSQVNFDLPKLIRYFEKIDINHKHNQHFIEQAGYAYCLKNLHGLSQVKYKIKGPVNEETIMKHYTAPRRALFFIEGIRPLQQQP